MGFIDRIRELAARIPKQIDYIQTAEATKNALIMPFIAALGYDVFNHMEVTPELNADIGIKKDEKVDYAILRDGKPIMLFECKHHAADLGKEHASQLYRYFSVTEARFSVLTNGINYWFYTDLEAPNKMDSKPFFEFNILNAREQDVEELKKSTKSAFDIEQHQNRRWPPLPTTRTNNTPTASTTSPYPPPMADTLTASWEKSHPQSLLLRS